MARDLGRTAYSAIAITARQPWFSRLHRAVYRRLGGRGVLGHVLGCDMLLLTTTGRRTGRPRTVPLFAFAYEGGPGARSGSWVVVASNTGLRHDPAWWRNLVADPRAIVELRGGTWPVVAREATGEERARLWTLVSSAYAGYELYERTSGRTAPVVVLDPA